ncbi:MAG: hypothetical protein Q8P18_26860 [Pseudomonadota bacterium]|nr:hypothetical protein [Pseudomonadota bacterium]
MTTGQKKTSVISERSSTNKDVSIARGESVEVVAKDHSTNEGIRIGDSTRLPRPPPAAPPTPLARWVPWAAVVAAIIGVSGAIVVAVINGWITFNKPTDPAREPAGQSVEPPAAPAAPAAPAVKDPGAH